jgi:outer membrane protein insertion porin family
MGFRNGMMKYIAALLVCALLISSCTEEKFLGINRVTVNHYPADTPFVYNVKIKVVPDNVSKADEKTLSDNLPDYLDDSLRSLKIQRFGVFYKIKNPPVFDTQNISRSEAFMRAYLNAQGYYHSHFKDTFYINNFKQQERATIVFTVDPGKVTIIDSMSYSLGDTTLRRIAERENVLKNSLITPGKSPFSKALIGNELDRLVNVYKNRGYLLLSRDNLYAEADTFNASLLQLPVDPFEQVQTIEAAEAKKKENPTASIAIKTRDVKNDSTNLVDSAQLIRYRVGNIYFYPESRFTHVPDSLLKNPPPVLYHDSTYTMYGRQGLFHINPLRRNSFLNKGDVYHERLYTKTINNLSSIGAWQNVESRTTFRDSNIVDFHYFLIPAEKENVTLSLEASYNTGSTFGNTGNLFGVALNATYVNRNVWHRAVQATTSFINGVELGLNPNTPFLQTFQSSISHAYTFPNIIIPAVKNLIIRKNNENINAEKTTISMAARYAERNKYFKLRSLITNMAFDWRVKNRLWQLKVPNVELSSLDTLDLLKEQFISNPFLKKAFNTGSIVSIILSFTSTHSPLRHTSQNNYYHFAVEEAGALTGFLPSLQDKIYRYIRVEGEYRKTFNFPRNSFVMRAFTGIGYNYGQEGTTLPFYKQFFAGGPNSMRAWALRQLGQGSSILYDTAGTKDNAFRDRYGDMQLEANLEYRYKIADFSSLKLGGAVFVDMGNIWNIKKDALNPNSEFNLSRLGKDIAIGVGTGLRFDFNYFLVRIDGGIKLKDPARHENNGWLNIANFTWKNYEYERKDADGKVISPDRYNFAVQLGIGLPF